MHAGVVTCPPSSSVAEMAALVARHRIHCLLVAGAEGRGWGIVTDMDLMRAVAAGRLDLTASQLAGMEVVTIGPDAELTEAARRMADHQVAHLVVSEYPHEQPIGVLSTLDVARAIG
jgi:arabinose-5-phosphate isomerase